MIFLNNVFLTDTSPPGSTAQFDRGLYKWDNKLDVYKYSLASLSKAYEWKKAIIYYKLDEGYRHREDELVAFIKSEFKDTELILRNKRNERQSDWVETYKLLDDELIWFYCNHDHVYLDYETDYFRKLVDEFRQLADEPCTLLFSHWSEGLLHACGSSTYTEHDNFIARKTLSCESIQIITKKYYETMWCKGDFEEAFLPRSDYNEGVHTYTKIPNHLWAVPLKELTRHYDGYAHAHPPCKNDKCPVLRIPPGFFENDIKIRYGYEENKDGWVNVNPLKKNFTTCDPNGTDYKLSPEHLPFFLERKNSGSRQKREF